MERLIQESTQYTVPEKIGEEAKTGPLEREDLTGEGGTAANQNAGGLVGADANADVPRYTNEDGTGAAEDSYTNYTASREWLFNVLKEQRQIDPGILEDTSVGVVVITGRTDTPTQEQLIRLVANSAGIPVDTAADKITIIRDSGVEVDVPAPEEEETSGGVAAGIKTIPLPILIAIGAGILLLLLLLILLLVRRRKRRPPVVMEGDDFIDGDMLSADGLEGGESLALAEEGAGVMPVPDEEEDEFAKNEEIMNLRMQRSLRLKQNIGDFVDQNPQIAAKLVQSWLRGEEVDGAITNPKSKAALVVVSLGADRASQIYKYLNEEDIEELTYEVAKLGKTSNTQVESTLDEFYKLCLTHKMMTDGGLDYARNVLEKAFGESTARNLLEKVSKTLQSKPFNFFMKGDPKALLSLLQNERPQVIALIMAYMEAEQAAQVLEQLPDEKRILTVESMARMDRVSPEAIAIVEEEMKRKFATIITSEDNMNLGGVDYVADMMNHIDRGSERKIFEELDKKNPELSQSIREKMFVFENIMDMDDRSVQRFVRECDSKDVVFALKGSSEDMKAIFFRNMSKRMAESVRADLEITTNVKRKDVEEAQQRIVNIIRKLEDQGEVIIKKGGADDDIIL